MRHLNLLSYEETSKMGELQLSQLVCRTDGNAVFHSCWARNTKPPAARESGRERCRGNTVVKKWLFLSCRGVLPLEQFLCSCLGRSLLPLDCPELWGNALTHTEYLLTNWGHWEITLQRWVQSCDPLQRNQVPGLLTVLVTSRWSPLCTHSAFPISSLHPWPASLQSPH